MDETEQSNDLQSVDYVGLTADLVSAYVANNNVPVAELPALMTSVHAALTGLGQGASSAPQVEKLTPAQIRKSITHDALISFEDGKPYKTLKRHLTGAGLTPETYRAKWGLPTDYPMTAAAYSESRSALARSLGLGRPRRDAGTDEPESVATEVPKRAGRPRKGKVAAEA